MRQRLFSGGLGDWLAITLLASTLGVPTPATAQTTNGVISGIVSDAQGAVLPGVTLTLRNTETGLTRTLVTETDGIYRAGGLPPGPYSIRAELQGFGTVEVAKVPGGWHFATPSSGDRAGVPGFAHLEDPAAAAAWPEGVAIRPLRGGWYLADRPT